MKNRTSKRLILLLLFPLILLLASCASTSRAGGPSFTGLAPVSPGKTLVYIYRPPSGGAYDDYRGILLYPYIDGTQIGTLRQAGFIYTAVAPGTHVLYFRDNTGILSSQSFLKDNKTSFQAQAGKIYFFRVVVTEGAMIKPGLTGAQNNLTETTAAQAIPELQGLQQSF